jgi:hypothetical protein
MLRVQDGSPVPAYQHNPKLVTVPPDSEEKLGCWRNLH